MSSYIEKFVNRQTGKIENIFCWDDYYGKHEYGYKLEGTDDVMREADFNNRYQPIIAVASSIKKGDILPEDFVRRRFTREGGDVWITCPKETPEEQIIELVNNFYERTYYGNKRKS